MGKYPKLVCIYTSFFSYLKAGRDVSHGYCEK